MLVFAERFARAATVATDDLSAPLGQNRTKARDSVLPLIVSSAIATIFGLALLVFAGFALFADDPLGGEPTAVASTGPDATTAKTIKTTDVAGAAQAPSTASKRPSDGRTQASAGVTLPGARTITIIDGSSGKRQNVVVPNPEYAKPVESGKTAEAAAAKAAKDSGPGAMSNPVAPLDKRVSEPWRDGLLPKIAADGTRPSQIFARPVTPIPGKPNAPRVAIVVGGLGISTAATDEAMRKLPAAVTFAFSGYGRALAHEAARARKEGHELLLQVPMEPDDSHNDPGPKTLLTSLDASHNVDRLHWLMSRFQGYVGIANAMGARFTASASALAPVLRETAKRGLIYVDDGSSPRSLAGQIAGANNLAFAKANAVLDRVSTPDAVDKALAQLESMARRHGVAIGMARALPVSIERIARWAKGAAERGILLVPITATVRQAKST
jgi:polysaccharide deacetylase 2 family uncharacterized protein YibQ